ncbi:DUF6263 family protein [Candidatus Palauibacter sp.]|uniref:DUF6263 family protein n=1 Tax=Candidatus Palauibacter sp. TaxID=3101350 RepID=UPI003CC690BB
MKSVRRGAGTATMIALAFALPLSGQSLLRLAPPEGQVNLYIYSMEMDIQNPMMPLSITLRAHQTQTILSAADEVIRSRTVIDSSTMTMSTPGGPPQPDLSGRAFTIEMDPRGRMLNVAADNAAGDEAEAAAQGLLEGSNFFWLPEAEVAAGDSWTAIVPVPLSLGGPAQDIEVEFTYTFTSLEDGQATITFTGPVESSLDMGGMPMSLSGELSGSLVVDVDEGRYVSQESQLSVEMGMGGMAMPTEMTTTLELVTDPT